MKFEKINENKIRIFLNKKDLIEKNVNLHSFMSNSIESQDLFMYALDKADKEFGFSTKDCKVRIEALAINTGDFIITVTKFPSKNSYDNSLHLLKPKLSKKYKQKNNTTKFSPNYNSTHSVYKFNTFDNFCDFCNSYLHAFPDKTTNVAKKVSLYYYRNSFYLSFFNINIHCTYLPKLFNLLGEFSTPIHCSYLYLSRLDEYGKVIFKNNALEKIG